jgi:hypothetical protein
MRHRHEEDEVQEILKRAMDIDLQKRTREDALRMSAAELGISEEALAQAEVQYLREKAEKDELEEFRAHQRRGYWEHLSSYIIVNSFLVAINLLNWNGHFWAAYPLLGWGIGILCCTSGTFNTRSEEYQKEFERWKRRRAKARAKSLQTGDQEEVHDSEDDDEERRTSRRHGSVNIGVTIKRNDGDSS